MSVEAFEKLITPKAGRTLIVGSRVYNGKEDRRKRYADVLGVDMQAGDGVDVVEDLEDISCSRTMVYGHYELAHYDHAGLFDHVECMSMLEHCKRPWLVAQTIESMLHMGGTILVTVPFVWRVHGYPDDYWRMTISGVKSLFTSIEWERCAYSGRHLTDDIPAIRSDDDWPHFSRTETCCFGVKL